MFIPVWIFWILFGIIIIITGYKIGKQRGSYDFISPIFGIGIILIGIFFTIGFLLGKIIYN